MVATENDYLVSYVENAEYTYDSEPHVARLSGYFIAPDSGQYMFYIMGRQLAKMYLTLNDTRVCTVLVLIIYYR